MLWCNCGICNKKNRQSLVWEQRSPWKQNSLYQFFLTFLSLAPPLRKCAQKTINGIRPFVTSEITESDSGSCHSLLPPSFCPLPKKKKRAEDKQQSIRFSSEWGRNQGVKYCSHSSLSDPLTCSDFSSVLVRQEYPSNSQVNHCQTYQQHLSCFYN